MIRRAATISVLLAVPFIAARLSASDPDPSKLAPTAEQAEQAQKLVAKLGNPVFRVRDDAARELKKLGRGALPALEETLKSTADPEVRNRCETLMPAIEEADLKVRLVAFLADTGRKYDHKLRAWPEFSKVAGDSPGSRQLFADVCQSAVNRELIYTVGQPRAELEKLILNRRMFLYNGFYRNTINGVRAVPKPADVFALLYVESGIAIANRSYQYVLQSLVNQTGVRSALAGDDGEPHRKILAGWMDSQTNPADIYQAMQVAGQLNLKEVPVGKYAEKVLANRASPTMYRLYALTTAARTMGKDALPVLAKGLDDTTAHSVTWFFNGERTVQSVQVRDIALAMSLIVSDQKLDDYGVEQRNRPNGLNLPDTARFSYMYYAFPTEKARAAAFEKFRDWEAKPKGEKKVMPPAKPVDK